MLSEVGLGTLLHGESLLRDKDKSLIWGLAEWSLIRCGAGPASLFPLNLNTSKDGTKQWTLKKLGLDLTAHKET